MELPLVIWNILFITVLAIVGFSLATVTSPSFWKYVKRKKNQKHCKECNGSCGDTIDGEGIWLECEHCKE